MDIDKVVIINGIETEVNNKEYLAYLRQNHKPITWEIIERLEGNE